MRGKKAKLLRKIVAWNRDNETLEYETNAAILKLDGLDEATIARKTYQAAKRQYRNRKR